MPQEAPNGSALEARAMSGSARLRFVSNLLSLGLSPRGDQSAAGSGSQIVIRIQVIIRFRYWHAKISDATGVLDGITVSQRFIWFSLL